MDFGLRIVAENRAGQILCQSLFTRNLAICKAFLARKLGANRDRGHSGALKSIEGEDLSSLIGGGQRTIGVSSELGDAFDKLVGALREHATREVDVVFESDAYVAAQLDCELGQGELVAAD